MTSPARTVLVTGGTSGIGLSCAEVLQSEGARVIVVGRELSRVAGRGFDTLETDFSKSGAIAELIGLLKTAGNQVHGWVLAAGVQEIRPLLMETADSINRSMQMNVTTPLTLIGAALKTRLIAPGGAIVLFSSVAAHAGGPGMVAYAASKAALEGAMRSLATEIAGQKIRVNAVAAGIVRTPMSERYLSRMTEAQRADLERAHPLGWGRPEDVARPTAFLLSDAARWITGTVLTIDGGFSCS